ncbi:MAG: hypothetical protein QNL11_06185 [Desulfobacterales bacterium]|nr:hypothetical protein [Desulfobacterales bacterium]
MNTKNIIILTVVLGVLTFGALSWASTDLPLMATKAHPNASGTASFSQDGLSIRAKGLQPDKVYTVWFVNMKPKKHEIGAGNPPYMFKTDSNGNGLYESHLSDLPFGKWAMLMVVLHPNGDPMDMKNMVGALSAKIPENR